MSLLLCSSLARALKADREALQDQLNDELLDQEAQRRVQAKSGLTTVETQRVFDILTKQAQEEAKNKQLLKILVHFVDTYYPRPSLDDAARIQKKKRVAPDYGAPAHLQALKTILSDLMNQAVVQPEVSYFTTLAFCCFLRFSSEAIWGGNRTKGSRQAAAQLRVREV